MFRYILENETEGDILGWTTSLSNILVMRNFIRIYYPKNPVRILSPQFVNTATMIYRYN